jgi:hypothetical protein
MLSFLFACHSMQTASNYSPEGAILRHQDIGGIHNAWS